jgi:hypothetical protein
MVRGVCYSPRKSFGFDRSAIPNPRRIILVKAQPQRRITWRARLAPLLISIQTRSDFPAPETGILDGVGRAAANVTTSRARHESQSYEKPILRAGRITMLDSLTE